LKNDDAVFLDVRLPAFYTTILPCRTDHRDSIPDFTRQVTIIINEDDPEHTASFTVAECLLTETSKYFIEVCRDWYDSTSRTLRLLDVDVDAFNSYVCWANRKVLAIDWSFVDGEIPPQAASKMVTLWLLGDRLADAKLRNAAMDAIIDIRANYGDKEHKEPIQMFPPHMTVPIWSTLAKGRALRRLLIDHYVENVTAEVMKPHWNECHPDFIRSLAMEGLGCGAFEGEAENDQAACDKFKYHEHVHAFNTYMYWTCKDMLPFNGRVECDGYMDAGLAFPRLEFLSKLWLLGDRLADSRFRNTVMDEIIDVIEWLDPLSNDFTAAFPPELTTAIWAATTQGQAIRRLVIDHYAYMVSPKGMEPHWDSVHPGFLKYLTMS